MSLLVNPQVGIGGLLGSQTAPVYPSLSANPYSPQYGQGPYTQQAMNLARNGYTHGPFASVAAPPAVPTPTSSSPSTLSQLLPLLGVAGLAAGNNGLLGSAVQSGVKGVGNYISSLLNPGTPSVDSSAPDISGDIANAGAATAAADYAGILGSTAAPAAAAVPAGTVTVGLPGAADVAAGDTAASALADQSAIAAADPAAAAGNFGIPMGTGADAGAAADAGASGSSSLGGLAAMWPAAIGIGGLVGLGMIDANQGANPYSASQGLRSSATGLNTVANNLLNGNATAYGISNQQAGQGLQTEAADVNQLANLWLSNPSAAAGLLAASTKNGNNSNFGTIKQV